MKEANIHYGNTKNILHKTVTGTTNTYGEMSLGISGDYVVVAVGTKYDGQQTYAIPRLVNNGDWWALVYSLGNIYTSRIATLEVYYMKL